MNDQIDTNLPFGGAPKHKHSGSVSDSSAVVMSDIGTLCAAFDAIGVEYTRRLNGEYEYVFIGDCRNIYNPEWTFEATDLDSLLRCFKYYEFENGKLASYFNS